MNNEIRRPGSSFDHRGNSPAHRKYSSGVPFPIERISSELLPYAEALRRARYEHLIPMLNVEVEHNVLQGLERCLVRTLDEIHPSSQPKHRKEDEVRDIRNRAEQLMGQLAEAGSFNEGVIPTIRVIPPEKLSGLCAPFKAPLEERSLLMSTDFGKAVRFLKEKWPELFIFLYKGRARESADTKPSYRKRDELPAKAYRIPIIQNGQSSLPSDFDFVAVAPIDPRNSINIPSYDEIAKRLKRSGFKEHNGGWAAVKISTRRSGFKRVEFGITGSHYFDESEKGHRRKRESLGHIFYPAFEGNYDGNNRLLPFLMESARVDIPILLIPYYHKGEGWMSWGLAVDFFGGFQDVARHRLERQSWLGRQYSIALYPFPEIAFPLESPQQLLFNLGYALRTWPWGDKQPIMGLPHMPLVTENQQEDPLEDLAAIKRFSEETQSFLAQHVIYPFSKMLREDNYCLGTRGQRAEFGISFLEDIALGLDGDPIATLLRLLPAGVTFTENDHYFFNTNTNIYGFGIFDENGLFPGIGKLLADKTILNELKTQIIKYEENLESVKDGWRNSTNTSGRGLLFNFLFGLAEGDPSKVVALLRPVWCGTEEWKKMMSKYSTRLIALDERFGIKGDRATLSKQILQILVAKKSPMAANEIAQALGKSPASVFHALSVLADDNVVVRLGGQRAERGAGPRGLGVGGNTVTFCLPDVRRTFAESGNIFRYLSPREKVVDMLNQSSGSLTVEELREATKLSIAVISAVLKRLKEEGKVETDGFRDWNELWVIKKD